MAATAIAPGTLQASFESLVTVHNVSDLQKYASGSTPYTIIIGSNISSSANNIYKNLTFSHDTAINANDDIQMYISNGTNFWMDHCSWTGHNMNTDSSIHANDKDKFFYDFQSTITRAPGLMRYGYFHCYNNFVYDFVLGYTPYTNCKIYSEKNYFDAGSHKGAVINGSGNNSQFYDTGSYSASPIGSIGTLIWKPYNNYGYATHNASDARTWAMNNCGSKSCALSYAID